MKGTAFVAVLIALTFSQAAGYGGLSENDRKPSKKKPTQQTPADSVNALYKSLDLISEMAADNFPMPNPIFDEAKLPPITVEGKLSEIQREIPLSYNMHVQRFIDKYSQGQYIQYLSRMKGLGDYYFDIYDRIFEEVGLPKHIKYLSIVESALDPHAVSRMGATGPWQFMYGTAKMYGLQMNKDEDQRKDPIAATYAAAEYLLKTYEQFGDWQLAIAAYNCGPGNVAKAIQRSGLKNPGFWEIMPYLPGETKNYIPAFIAMTYMMEYHDEHGIKSIPSGITSDIEIVSVKHRVNLEEIAKAVDTDLSVIKTLNPSYKRDFVPASIDNPKRIILPAVAPVNFQNLYAVLYEKGNFGFQGKDHQFASLEAGDQEAASVSGGGKAVKHRVRKGETLGAIAQKYNVTVQDLKVWNNLKSTKLMIGQSLEIESYASSVEKTRTSAGSKSTKQTASYVVKKGDSLSSIAGAHRGTTIASLKAANGLKSNRLQPGMKLKIM